MARDMWDIEIRHEGLNKYRHIRGSDKYVVEQKARAQCEVWDEMWEKKCATDRIKREKEAVVRSKEEKKEFAVSKTIAAKERIGEVETLLLSTLKVDDTINWSSLIDSRRFPEKKPVEPKPFPAPVEPRRTDAKYQPKLGLFDKLFSQLRKKKEAAALQTYTSDHDTWTSEKTRAEQKNKTLHGEYSTDLKRWEERKVQYENEQENNNQKILEKKELYLAKEPGIIGDYCEMVLTNSKYPEYFPQEWDIDYNADTRTLVVDYSLPEIGSFPTTNEVKYVQSKDEFTESSISTAALNKLYDDALYQMALRTIHELFEADAVDAIDSVVFNGWVESIDRATGNNANACIMSVQTTKSIFLAINLEKVDPKACFKQLKGVGSSKLHGLSPIAPIINIDKNDRRFISAYNVADGLSDCDNLAAMDWQDFENLIREIFEKEFASSGGEVKITQASRDGGVDAVAFDPDPIRGGKIVIQAKRYTNVVGVSAVRDLYGTTVNEGATKGILVTTADYGPDAYEFVKGKPLTLLNGSNLLHLLQKHGHRAKIDLKEAKQALSESKAN